MARACSPTVWSSYTAVASAARCGTSSLGRWCAWRASVRFDALVVEATGVAEPLPIAMAFDEEEVDGHPLSEFAGVDSMVTVVDAFNFLRDWERGADLAQVGLAIDSQDIRTVADLLAEQVEFANQIIVNKADLVSPADLERLTQLLACLNPEARIVVTMFGHVSVDELLDTRLYDREGEMAEEEARRADEDGDAATVGPSLEAEASFFGPFSPHSSEARSLEPRVHAALDIRSFVYRARRPFPPPGACGPTSKRHGQESCGARVSSGWPRA